MGDKARTAVMKGACSPAFFLRMTIMIALLVGMLPLAPAQGESAAALPTEGPNLLLNGSFEQITNGLPASWSKWIASGYTGNPQFTLDENTVKSGSRSLRIQSAEPARASINQSIRVEQNQSYRLSVWAKLDNIVSTDRGVVMRYQFFDANNTKIGTDNYVGARKGTAEWDQITHQATVPAGAARMLVEYFLWAASGTVWFDDAQVSKVIPITDRIRSEHPRLLATSSDFAALKDRIAADPRLQSWYDKLYAKAETILTEPASIYEIPDGVRLLAVSRKVKDRIQTLGLMYRLTKDSRFAERAWKELEAAGRFKDWNPSHFLDTAEMTYAFAIGYDWLYDYWSAERKLFLRDATVNKGFNPALAGYKRPDFWVNTSNNWNFVVNGGIGMGALAFGDEPEVKALAEDLLGRGFQSLPKALAQWAPDGGWYEGPGYWAYSVEYAGLYMKALKTAVGTDFGLSQSPGFPLNGDFPIHMSGPINMTFNFADAGSGLPNSPSLHWFGSEFNKPEYGWWQAQRADLSPSPLDLLWYAPNDYPGPRSSHLQLDKYFRNVEAVSMRSSWEDPRAVFAGFKGTSKEKNHNNLDAGTFVLDALGVRWAQELGADNYNLPGYFGGERWTYYRMRGEGQNVLVINPDESPDQEPAATISISKFASSPQESFAVADLTQAYAKNVVKAERGIRLLDHRRQLLIQDEVQAKSPSDVWWFMHTATQMEQIAPDGQWAMLNSNGKRLWARILSPSQAKFVVMDAVPLPTSPNPEGQNSNAGIRKLAIHLEDVQDLRLAVLMVPLREGESPPVELPQVMPLSEWNTPAAEVSLLHSITVGGKPLESFTAEAFTYDVNLPDGTTTAPIVTAVAADSNASVHVRQASGVPGTAWINVSTPSGGTGTYQIHFQSKVSVGAVGLPVADVTASSDDGNIALNTIDDDLDSRWSAEGDGEWIRYALGAPSTIRSVSVAWYRGNERTSSFDIEVSGDGALWTRVFSGRSSGITTGLENYAIGEHQARYVRIIGHGNSQNQFNSITEVRIYDRVVSDPHRTPELKSVSLSTNTTGLKVSQSTRLQLSGAMNTGESADLTRAKVEYFSSNPEVVSVSGDGVVTAVGEGSARVVAAVTLDGYLKFAGLNFTVMDPLNRVFTPAKDTFARDGSYADINYGSSGNLTVKRSSIGFQREAFLQFDLGDLTGDVDSAVLYLYGNVADSAGTEIDNTVRAVENDSWAETGLTWNNRPSTGASLATTRVNSQPAWREFDITDFVKAQAAGDRTASLAVIQETEPGLSTNFYSKESGKFKPYLKVKLLDSHVPAISVTGITYGGSYANSVTPVITAEDAETGVKSLSITVDGKPHDSGTNITALGVHELTATAADYAGNVSNVSVTFAVYDPTAGPVTAAGWFSAANTETVTGSTYGSKVHLQANLGYNSLGQPEGSLRIHDEPRGIRFELQQIKFLVIAEQTMSLVGTGIGTDGQQYHAQLELLNDAAMNGKPKPTVSVSVWPKERSTPVMEATSRQFTGNITFHK